MRRWLAPAAALLLSSALSVVGASCSCGDAATSSGAPCDSVLKAQCGVQCTYDAECPTGLYCSPDKRTCTADCAAGAAQCPSGLTCSQSGRCVSGGGAGGDDSTGAFGNTTGVGGGSGIGGGSGCNDVTVTFEKQTPTVMLLLDQSGSMTAQFGGAPSRWDALYTTLMDPANGVVKALEGEVRFGLALYTSHNGNDGGECPILTEVPIALDNFDAIDAVYARADPDRDTPTGASLQAVTTELAAFAEPGPKVIVLATDGEPDTCTDPNPNTNAGRTAAKNESIAGAQNAFTQGIQTFIISVGDEVSTGHLQDMANAGVGLPIGGATLAPFYVALNQQTLVDAFATIINGVRSCTITLNGTLAAEDAGLGTVTLDGQALTLDDPNGWAFHAPNEVELLGTACQTIQDGEHDLQVKFPCDTVTPF